MEISLNELLDDAKKSQIIFSAFESMSFSFYTYWKSNDAKSTSSKSDLVDYFGVANVIECLNRIDYKLVQCPMSVIRERLLDVDLLDDHGENWLEVENFLGCLTQKIDL